MNKLTKLIIIIILSMSVYYIYMNTNNSRYKILNLGDKLSLGINSYGIKESGYIDYYKEYLSKEKDQIEIINTYANRNQSISSILSLIRNTPEIKGQLSDSNILIITLGYNDLLFGLSLEEEQNIYAVEKVIKEIEKNYNDLIDEITKFYHREIIVIGYFESNKDDYYLNQGIIELNKVLKNNTKVNYIDTYSLLSNRIKYFSNPQSYFPNRYGYYLISKKIISKTLEFS